MSTLFIIYRSPNSSHEMHHVLQLTKPGDVVLLMQDAVLALKSVKDSHRIEQSSSKGIKFYAARSDAKARSMKQTPSVKFVDYDEIVELLLQCDNTYS